jgi:hypothetical protein
MRIPDPNLDPDQTGRPDHKPKPGQLLKRQHVVNLSALSAYIFPFQK